MALRKLMIFGTNTCAKNVYNFVKKYNLFDVIGFTVDSEYYVSNTFCDHPVYDINNVDSVFSKDDDLIFIAMQWNRLNKDRRNVYERLKGKGFHFANLISPKAIVNGKLLGDNCWICDNVVIDFGSKIHENVFIKIKALIADDCEIFSHSFIGANSTLGGGVIIGEQSFIGLGAVVFDNVKVGNKCIVGATTSLKRNLPSFSIIKTSSEQFVIAEYSEDLIESKLMFKKNIR